MLAEVVYLFVMVFLGRESMSQEPILFPENFKWCVATSAHQIEGYNDQSDWWDWEQIPGKIKNGDKSGAACDHWNRLTQDVELLKSLNVKQYRFSIEWAKIEPEQGVWNTEAIAHYQKELQLLSQSQIEPIITLHHFTLPRWFRKYGGWEWSEAPAAFLKYVNFVYKAFGTQVQTWITFNEPMVHLVGGYIAGATPPGDKREISGILSPLKGLLKSHAAAYHELHRLAAEEGKTIRVGFAHHLRIFDPNHSWSLLDTWAANTLDQAFNWSFVEAIETGVLKFNIPFVLSVEEKIEGLEHTQDFMGVNYYTRDRVKFHFDSKQWFELVTEKDAPKTDMGWEIYPKGFYRILKKVGEKFPSKPILITENGLADAKDEQREKFLKDHLLELHRAIQEGVPVENYCYWSLLDNFEWVDGFGPRFGLFEVDYTTQMRTLRKSGKVFSQMAKDNGWPSCSL